MEGNRLEMIENMLKKNPNDSFLNYAAALEHQKNGNLQQASEIIERLLAHDPDYLGAYYQLGKIYEELNQTEQAISTYRKGKAIARKQNDQKTIGELSEALMFLDEEAEDF